jgi:hypothetical protein
MKLVHFYITAILKPRNLKASRDWQEPEGDVYIRDIWDCISLKRKVIDGKSMIGKPNLKQ